MDREASSRKPQLNKGKACFNCRRRKVKCDAKKPICTPCGRFIGGGLQDCEYTERGPAQSQILQEQISILEDRIQEIERPKDMKMAVGLQNPYQSGRRHISDPPADWASPPHHHHRDERGLFQALSRSFLPYGEQIGFFLSPQLFEVLPLASPALLDTICLWGAHLSRSEQLNAHQARFLSDALRSTAAGLVRSHSPHAIIHTIQAELLLAQYFFHNARILEGKYHASTAVSISISSGLHKIRSADVHGESVRSVIDSLSPAATAVEEGERINAFWAVFTVNNCWLAADGSPADISYAVVDTPWPLGIGEYSEDSRSLPGQSSGTIDNFLARFPDRGTSLPALHAKAAIIFEQASRLAARFTETAAAHRAPSTRLSTEFSTLDGVIEAFKGTLPSLDSGSRARLLVVHTLAHVATIQLHNPFSFTSSSLSRTRSTSAALAVVGLVREINLHELGFVDAIMGTLWTAACQVFITELSRATYGVEDGHGRRLSEAVETLLGAMSVFSRGCRMIELQLGTAQQNYAAVRRR
ncbi:Zn(2)-Cys(6) binuclear cluster domain-containing protein [Mycena filopes]|nr:Zn(2)-Cys(6) binuclear cluster domain-containing protein [Mycena filopes]